MEYIFTDLLFFMRIDCEKAGNRLYLLCMLIMKACMKGRKEELKQKQPV